MSAMVVLIKVMCLGGAILFPSTVSDCMFLMFVPHQVYILPAPGFNKLSDDEIRLANKWYDESVPPCCWLLVERVYRRSRWRRPALTQAQIAFLIRRRCQRLYDAAGGFIEEGGH